LKKKNVVPYNFLFVFFSKHAFWQVCNKLARLFTHKDQKIRFPLQNLLNWQTNGKGSQELAIDLTWQIRASKHSRFRSLFDLITLDLAMKL